MALHVRRAPFTDSSWEGRGGLPGDGQELLGGLPEDRGLLLIGVCLGTGRGSWRASAWGQTGAPGGGSA